MRELAQHYERMRRSHPGGELVVVFDIDGTILDLRHLVHHVLLGYDRQHHTDWFHGLRADDIDVHENRVEGFLAERPMPDAVREAVLAWYLERRWQPEAMLAAHRPYRGVLDVIRWFQLQPGTDVALNTGRPEVLRADTLRCLNTLGQEYRVYFDSDLLHMNSGDWEEGVADSKVDGLRALRAAGRRVVAVVDNEPANLDAIARSGVCDDALLLHADTIYESAAQRRAGTVSGRSYDVTALISERGLPGHVQLVWHGVNDVANLRQFLASAVRWCECDVRVDPLDRLVLRHDSFDETPWSPEERCPDLAETLVAVTGRDRAVKLDLKTGGEGLDRVLGLLDDLGVDDEDLWFNGGIESLGEEGFRKLRAARPGAVVQCPIDFLTPLVLGAPAHARAVLAGIGEWGIDRVSLAWGGPHARTVFDRLDRWGHDVNLYAVPDLESFLQAALLLPTSLTADFNFPAWHYFGRGSGERQAYHRYRRAADPAA